MARRKKNIKKRKRNTHNSDVRFIMENGEASDVPLACVAWRFCREQDWAAKPQFSAPNQNRHVTQANEPLYDWENPNNELNLCLNIRYNERFFSSLSLSLFRGSHVQLFFSF